MTNRVFSGPLFLVGLPRSGTKLLRELLNRNPGIGVPSSESHFIPHLRRRFGPAPRFDDPGELHRFYVELSHTNFFWNMRRNGLVLPENVLRESDLGSWPAVLETVFRYYAPPGRAPGFIWGDKTPSYLTHMDLLKSIHPQARFVHIVRDPRDSCLSARSVWNKSLLRSADRWRAAIVQAQRTSASIGGDYLEIRYEDLLTRTESLLRQVCDFLGCDFSPAMLTLESPAENLGSAKDATSVVAGNLGKYKERLGRRQIRRIEEIVFPVARSCGYELHFATAYRPLSPLARAALAASDGVASALFHVRSKGLLAGLRYIYRFHSQVRWQEASRRR